MEAAEVEEALKVLEASLTHIKWRLKSSSKRRLQIDVLALCNGMRPVVMIDYGGKMPELQEHLCAFLQHSQKIRTLKDKNLLGMQLISIQKVFSLYFPLEGVRNDLLPPESTELGTNTKSFSEPINSQSSIVMDLSGCMHDTKVTVPTINGWLLGYPVVYLFSKDNIGDAIYNLSTKFLRIYKVLVCRSSTPGKGSHPEELMSFSVPYDLSMRGSNEPWAEMFLARLQSKWGRCKQTWSSLEMDVRECYPQAIAL
ncbi:hypothetical protein REPUB_Repub20aG0031600 [Reevesia pubescens]